MSTASAIAKVVAVVAALVIGLALTWGVFRLAGQERKQGCIEEAQARFPAVGLAKVNPFTPSQTWGPVRVSNVDARNAALNQCEATLF